MLNFFFKYLNRLALEKSTFLLNLRHKYSHVHVHSLSKFTWHGLRSYAFHASVCIAISHKIKRKFEDGEAHFSISMCSQSIVSSFRIAQALSLSHAQKNSHTTPPHTPTHKHTNHKHSYVQHSATKLNNVNCWGSVQLRFKTSERTS